MGGEKVVKIKKLIKKVKTHCLNIFTLLSKMLKKKPQQLSLHW